MTIKLNAADQAKLDELREQAEKMSWSELCQQMGVPVETVLRLAEWQREEMVLLMVIHGMTATEALLHVSEAEA